MKVIDKNTHIGELIKGLGAENNVSGVALSNTLGWSRPRISNIYKSTLSIGLGTFLKVLEALGYKIVIMSKKELDGLQQNILKAIVQKTMNEEKASQQIISEEAAEEIIKVAVKSAMKRLMNEGPVKVEKVK